MYASLVCTQPGSAAITERPPAGSFTTTPLKLHHEKDPQLGTNTLLRSTTTYCKQPGGYLYLRETNSKTLCGEDEVAARTLSQPASVRCLLRFLGCMKIDYLLAQVGFPDLNPEEVLLLIWTILGQVSHE